MKTDSQRQNDITIRPADETSAIKEAVESALKRDAELDAERITVRADGSKVTLSGKVDSWDELDEAEFVSRSVPGVTMVQNDIVISCQIKEVIL